jgi:hypothetical protein
MGASARPIFHPSNLELMMIRKMIPLASLALLLGSAAHAQVNEYPWQVGRAAQPTAMVVHATGLPDGPTRIEMRDALGHTIAVVNGEIHNGLVHVMVPHRYRGCILVADGMILRRCQ